MPGALATRVRIAREILVEKLSRVASCSTSAAAFDARPRVAPLGANDPRRVQLHLKCDDLAFEFRDDTRPEFVDPCTVLTQARGHKPDLRIAISKCPVTGVTGSSGLKHTDMQLHHTDSRTEHKLTAIVSGVANMALEVFEKSGTSMFNYKGKFDAATIARNYAEVAAATPAAVCIMTKWGGAREIATQLAPGGCLSALLERADAAHRRAAGLNSKDEAYQFKEATRPPFVDQCTVMERSTTSNRQSSMRIRYGRCAITGVYDASSAAQSSSWKLVLHHTNIGRKSNAYSPDEAKRALSKYGLVAIICQKANVAMGALNRDRH